MPDEKQLTEADLGATSRGVWTRRSALEVLSRGRIQTRLDDGSWQVVWPGVYADGGVELDAEQRGIAAVLASGGDVTPRKVVRAVACGRSAARVLGFPLIDDDDPATGAAEHLLDDVAVAYAATSLTAATADGSVRTLTRHHRAYRGKEIVRRPSGLYVSSPLRTLVDCAGLLTYEALVCAIDDALHRHVVSADDLERTVADRAWCADVVALRRAVSDADIRAESPAESLARIVLRPVVPGRVPQVRLTDSRGVVVARFDLGDREIRLAVEADGKAAHARMAARDQKRDRTTEVFGWRTERCVWFELRCRQDQLRQRIAGAAADQARRHRR